MKQVDCLTEDILTSYLDGELTPDGKADAEAHMLLCNECRKHLAFLVKLLRDELEPAEKRALQTIRLKWVSRSDFRGAPVSGARRMSSSWKKVSGGLAAAIVLALGAQSVIHRVSQPRSATEVIHLLLAERRPFEARISGQPYLPYSVTRSMGDAEKYPLLAGQMVRLSATSYELGQFYLLQKDFGRAIQYLSLAAQEPGISAATENDLGVAYMESGDAASSQKAIEAFRHALVMQPDFTPALYNLAILYDRLDRDDLAEDQVRRFLQLEPDQKWKEDIRLKLEGVIR